VPGHPVHDDADAGLVEAVDQVAQVVGAAEATGHGVVAGDLVAPRAAEGVLGERHELDVGEAELADVLDQLVGQVAVVEPRTPRADVQLVDAHRAGVDVVLGAGGHPGVVGPGVGGLGDHRAGERRHLGGAGHRVRALDPDVVGGKHLVLVDAVRDAGHEELPDAVAVEAAHRVPLAVPAVEVARHADGTGVRRPDGEGGAGDALVLAHVAAEHLPELLVAALAEQVQVELGDGGGETVGVVGDPRRASVVGRLDRVRADGLARDALPEAVGHVLEREGRPGGTGHGDRLGQRSDDADGSAAAARVRAEDGVRVAVGAGGDGEDLVVAEGEEAVGVARRGGVDPGVGALVEAGVGAGRGSGGHRGAPTGLG
jgi:hypothetical protein